MDAEPPSSGAFYTADHIEEEEEAPVVNNVLEIDPASPEFEDFFEIERVVKWIKDNSFKRVALQLPDNFLASAFPLSRRVEKESGAKIYVLADTSYRSCCVDAVAAEHANCDSLIHFGEACMSAPTAVIPVLYVFGKLKIDFDDLKSQLTALMKEESNNNLVLIYDPGYASISSLLLQVVNLILIGIL